MNYVRCTDNNGNEASLHIGTIYQTLPTTSVEDASGMIRVIDNEGEDYLYPRCWFDEVPTQEMLADLSESLTIHLNGLAKLSVRDLANAQGVTMSSLVRQWIEERLDLPDPQSAQ